VGLWLALGGTAESGCLSSQPPPVSPPAAEMEKLIAQLGSKTFGEREKASKALSVVGQPALEALRKAARENTDAEIRSRAGQLVQQIENRLDSLLVDYRAYGLPMPPKDAKLVRYICGGGGVIDGKQQDDCYCLGFLVKPGSPKEPPTILLGTTKYQPVWPTKPQVIEPERLSPKEAEALPARDRGEWGGLELAIQCKARGWDVLAQAIFESYFKNLPQKKTPRSELLETAWRYWYGQLLKPSTDWKMINNRLKAFIEADKSLASPAHLAMLRSLEAALIPSKAEPGSIAALVDELIDCKSTDVDVGARASDPRYMKLVLAGFAAVPELIEHLEDDRLTRARIQARGFRFDHCRVKHLVSCLLQGLSGQSLGEQWLTVEKARAMKWWRIAQKVGEENYLVKNVLSSWPQGDGPNAHQLRMIGDKYPNRLPEIYRTLLDRRPRVYGWSLAEAIARSKLPREKKIELLVYASTHKKPEHRTAALWHLRQLDKKKSAEQLIETLERLPASATEPY
jgi:hypothetical protein